MVSATGCPSASASAESRLTEPGWRPSSDLDATHRREAFRQEQEKFAEREAIKDEHKSFESMSTEDGQQHDGSAADLVRLSSVKAEKVRWLWTLRIPRGKITVLDGDPGLGKSCAALDLAARVTCGLAMPDEPPEMRHERRNVILLSAEDGLADTIRARFDEAGGDAERLYVLVAVTRRDGTRDLFSLGDDVAELEQSAAAVNAALVIIDPLTAYLGAKVNSWRDQDVRRVLAPLAALAEKTGAAIVLIRHLNKSKSENPLYRGGGSIGIVGAARVSLIVEKDPDNPARRLLACAKSNVGKTAPTLAYAVEGSRSDPDVPVILWEAAPDPRSAAEIVVAAGETYAERSARGDARGFLRQYLADGPMPASEVAEEGKREGHAMRTLRRAYGEVGTKPKKEGFTGPWMWGLR